ncbi:hypothetical protein QUF58_02875 [Anaerolineales bacterium HSG24]|nr:hypothetical protein [Anaerolineales bacterium HSG24]
MPDKHHRPFESTATHFINYRTAERQRVIDNYQRAKRRAFTEEMLSTIRHTSVDLLPFEVVRTQLKLGHKQYRGRQEIPLDQIVGSVNRSEDFTRTFSPRHDAVQNRWQQVDKLVDTIGLLPIELYQVSRIYFVKDGHHRVSVMRQQAAEVIEAEVWEYPSRVQLWADDNLEDIMIRREYLEFLERTQLDKYRPQVDIILTMPGRYWLFEEKIAIHRYYLGLDEQRDPTFTEAMLDWYDTLYLPLAQQLHADDIVSYFPGRTEADIALHIFDHQYWLEEQHVHDDISLTDAMEDFSGRLKRNLWQRLKAWVIHRVLGHPVYSAEE